MNEPAIPTAPDWQQRLPNALTMGRVALAVVFFAMLAMWSYDHSPLARGAKVDPWLLYAAAIFIGAAATDALDGHLARRWKVVSVFGRIMDPFADKVLVIGAFVMLAGPGFVHLEASTLYTPYNGTGDVSTKRVLVSHVAPWMVVVILARELLVTSIRGAYESRGVSFAATWSGKWKMILQCICVPLVLVLVNFRGEAGMDEWKVDEIIRWVVWVTVGVTAWSGVPYVLRAVRESGKLKEGQSA